jgi:multisubunit Na+/H+ antiporter MnhB subunit
MAWAMNGFASVISACAAVLLAMVYGFNVLLALAAAIYAGAGLLSIFFGPAVLHEREKA